MKSTGTQSVLVEMSGNRTGLLTSPELAEELIEGAREAVPSSAGSSEELAAYRSEYIKEGFPFGSLPSLPVAQEAQADEEAAGTAVLLDKLSERLAFERTGTRLYDALINKCQVLGEDPAGPTLAQLQHIREEELTHFLLLNRAITELGGDPTVQSPSADLAGVISIGILQVVTDPRSSMTQCLQAMLSAELSDNDGWQLLIKLADNLGYQDLVTAFQRALENEEEHLSNVRNWLSEQILDNAQA